MMATPAKSAFAALMNSSAERHSVVDDAQGVISGSMLAVLGITLFSAPDF